jgi:hypothetical protein
MFEPTYQVAGFYDNKEFCQSMKRIADRLKHLKVGQRVYLCGSIRSSRDWAPLYSYTIDQKGKYTAGESREVRPATCLQLADANN